MDLNNYIEFNNEKLYKAENLRIVSPNNQIIEAGKIKCFISDKAKIDEKAYVSIDAKICGDVTIERNCYIGQNSIILNGVLVRKNIMVTPTSQDPVHNKTKEEVEKYFNDEF